MSVNFPTTKELTDQNIAVYENKLNQTVPPVEKSFVKVTSVNQAIIGKMLYIYGQDAIKQALVITATDLEKLKTEQGSQYNVIYRNEVATILSATIPGTDGTTINAGTDFKGDSNGLTYYSQTSQTVAAGISTLSLKCRTPGVSGNLNNGETLTIVTQIAGLTQIATITATTTTGAEAETLESYKTRILDVIRSKGGGANLADYRIWGQEVTGVERIYPYSGDPEDPTRPPPHRTLYVECEPSIEPDGIAPPALLDQVRDSVTTDPTTGIARQPLGLTNDTLIIRPISVTGFYVEVRGLYVPLGDMAEQQQNIETALDLFFESVQPYIDGLDPLFLRRDKITDIEISAVVQSALTSAGASCNGVGFGLSAGVFITEYNMKPGEEAKLAVGGLTFG
jgi:hypothetical protein